MPQNDESLRLLEEIRYALDQAAIVALTDQRGIITYVNDKFCEISKYSATSCSARITGSSIPGTTRRNSFAGCGERLPRGNVWRGEMRNLAKDGSVYWVDTTIVPLLNADGKPRQYLAIRSDITQRKAMEQQLADQAALAQLGQLAAVVAHEVRNPLAGVKGSLQVLRSRPATATGDKQIIEAMISRLDALNSKVDDILRFARPRSPVLEVVDVRSVITDACAEASANASNAIRIPATGALVRADREMLRATILNLLMNACQSGSSEPVEVQVRQEEAWCRIDIADRGAGLGDTDPEQLFQAFHTTKTSGTGLGLAITRRLVTLQGGTVRLMPREGGGAIACVMLPWASPNQ